jgi:hypothetical protein
MNTFPFDASRRRHPRIEVDDPVKGEDLTQRVRVRLRDISAGGFQTESAQVPTVGDPHLFHIRLKSGRLCVLHAIAVHCRVLPGPSGSCLVGWRLTDDTQGGTDIRLLIEDVTTLAIGGERDRVEPGTAWAVQSSGPEGMGADAVERGGPRE